MPAPNTWDQSADVHPRPPGRLYLALGWYVGLMARHCGRLGLAALASGLLCAILITPGLRAHEGDITVVSAASFDREAPLAPNSVAIIEGEFADRTTEDPEGVPQAQLDSVTVVIEGAGGDEHVAGIFAVKPQRLEVLIPDLPEGTAHLRVRRDELEVADGEFQVRFVSPGLFSASASGGGLAAAVAVRVNLADETTSTQDVAFFNTERGAYEPILLNPAAEGFALYLTLLGTGIRNGSNLSVEIGGISVPSRLHVESEVSYGLDQVIVGPLPVELAHRTLVDIALTVDGIRANTVQVAFSPSTGDAVTFSNQIVRLFQGSCQTCHRPGEVAPFSLLDYESAKSWVQPIKQETQARYMPPWKPIPGHGKFVGERRLSDAQINLIANWVDAGAPEGDPADLPEPLAFDPEWALGEPDLVLETPEYSPDPNASDDYRCFSIPIPAEITERKSITKVEVQPGNRRIVHHLILYGDPVGESKGFEAATQDGAPGYECFGSAGISFDGLYLGVESYILGGWAPGNSPQVLPEDTGYYLRPGSRIAIQLHYHPDGTQQTDSTRIGLHFSDEPTPRNTMVLAAINQDFEIPPGEERYEVRAEFSFDRIGGTDLGPFVKSFLGSMGFFPADVIAVLPHMHLLGQEIRMDKISPIGEKTPMIRIDDWDFDWQDTYTYVEPVPLGADDRLEVLAIYDNSASNPHNPNDPPIPVGWGEQTTDEMCIVFFLLDVPDLCRLGLGLCGG